MEMKVKCPICGHQADYECYSGPMGLEEDHTRCPHCGYYQEFTYGFYYAVIGKQEFTWAYFDYSNKNQMSLIYKKMKKAAFSVQHNLRKGRNKNKKKGM